MLHSGLFEAFEEPGGADFLRRRDGGAWRRDYPWLQRSALPPCSGPNGSRPLDVGVHVRRGDVFVHPQSAIRTLDNAYYVEVVAALQASAARARLPPLRVTFYMDAVYAGDESHLRLHELRAVGALEYGTDVFATALALATADVLVMSRSSFSYLAALVHDEDRGGVVYHPFWHVPRADWHVVGARPVDAHSLGAWLAQRHAAGAFCAGAEVAAPPPKDGAAANG